MKKVALFLSVLVCFSMLGCASSMMKDASDQPRITVAGPARLDKEGVLDIHGKGFKPNEEITLIFVGSDGVDSDIGFALDPQPLANTDGSWQTKWSYGRLVAKKLVKAGAYELSAVDKDFNLLSKTVVSFE